MSDKHAEKVAEAILAYDFRDWLYKNGYHYQGDFHVMFPRSGGVIDLAKLLANFVAASPSTHAAPAAQPHQHVPVYDGEYRPICGICGASFTKGLGKSDPPPVPAEQHKVHCNYQNGPVGGYGCVCVSKADPPSGEGE